MIKCPKCGNTELFGWYCAFLRTTKFEYDIIVVDLKNKMKNDLGIRWKLKDDVLYFWKIINWIKKKKLID